MKISLGFYKVCLYRFICGYFPKVWCNLRWWVYKGVFVWFFYQSKNMAQDCFDTSMVSDALPQNTKVLEKMLKAQMFCCSLPQNPLMCDKEDRMRSFSKS